METAAEPIVDIMMEALATGNVTLEVWGSRDGSVRYGSLNFSGWLSLSSRSLEGLSKYSYTLHRSYLEKRMATVIILRPHYVEVCVPVRRVDAPSVAKKLLWLSLGAQVAASRLALWRLHLERLLRAYIGSTLVDLGVALERVSWKRRDRILS